MKKIANGIYPTMVTPFRDGKIDECAVKQLVEYYIASGCQGVFAVCQSSEMSHLSLRERAGLAKSVVDAANGRISVVASGHVSDGIAAQAEEINAIWDAGVDVVTLVTNRLDINNEGDDKWLANMDKLLSLIPDDIAIGLYECPNPYKRLLSDRLLDWCMESGRISFIKDTCCCPDTIEQRLNKAKGSDLMFFNANGQTLLHSLRHGAVGYTGIMANFCPELLCWLYENFDKQPDVAEIVSNVFSMMASTENCYYPMTAKYALQLAGVDITLDTRSLISKDLPEYQRLIVRQIRQLAQYITDKVTTL